jgi:demethoxyubiquinone hydroxylase (CLK1/Coq7/Cat5 family)
MILELQVHLENHMKDKLDELEKKIPITNEELLKEVQQMRDDFLALRQNF